MSLNISLYEQARNLTALTEKDRQNKATERARQIIDEITPALLESARNGNYIYSFALADEDRESSTNYTVKTLSNLLEAQGLTTNYTWGRNTFDILRRNNNENEK